MTELVDACQRREVHTAERILRGEFFISQHRQAASEDRERLGALIRAAAARVDHPCFIRRPDDWHRVREANESKWTICVTDGGVAGEWVVWGCNSWLPNTGRCEEFSYCDELEAFYVGV